MSEETLSCLDQAFERTGGLEMPVMVRTVLRVLQVSPIADADVEETPNRNSYK
jgi:hypothetical protein